MVIEPQIHLPYLTTHVALSLNPKTRAGDFAILVPATKRNLNIFMDVTLSADWQEQFFKTLSETVPRSFLSIEKKSALLSQEE
jgi:hypothetical protein